MTDTSETEERETNAAYDDADANNLLEAKLRCLEWAIKENSTTEEIIKTASKYWDFIVYNRSENEQG